MTRRLAIALLALVAVVAFAAASSEEGGGGGIRYVVELDNAFGMVEEGDVRVAGTNAGKIKKIELDERTKKALVEIELTEKGFGSFRTDAECESRPQSPLGEFYLDCRPGLAPRELEEGDHVKVERTTSTIPPDLVTNIMRRPFRERFRLILAELGAGLAGRPEELNAAIRRAVPALRQSANLLEILGDHNTVIKRLVTDADRVIGKLAENKENVGRFVAEAEDTATASAERSSDIATNFRKLPGFLTELTPTMAALEEVAREQRPVLVDLSASASNLRRFFDVSAEFSDASRPALRALGDAAPVGTEAVRAARPRIGELRDYARPNVDLANNLAITLEDFDDRDRAVEPHPRSPGGKGFTGTEALLQYVFIQTIQTNAFDQLGHLSRVALIQSRCGPLTSAEDYKAREAELKTCRAWLGPNQPGITTPDPTAPAGQTGRPPASGEENPPTARSGVTPDKGSAGGSGAARGGSGGGGGDRAPQPLPDVQREIERILDELQSKDDSSPDPSQLLDFLLGP
ncbi:MAG TPA: MlaD family protein [Thermoleophilaceae bacterium]|jgi:ABC-type transporter Mla subunit MlaD